MFVGALDRRDDLCPHNVHESRLAAEASAFRAQGQLDELKATNDGDKRLFEKGFITASDLRRSESNLANAERANEAEKKRFMSTKDGLAPRLAA